MSLPLIRISALSLEEGGAYSSGALIKLFPQKEGALIRAGAYFSGALDRGFTEVADLASK